MTFRKRKPDTDIGKESGLYDSTHDDEHFNQYGRFKTYQPELDKRLYNSKNLFDDSDIQDRKWMKIAKEYLSKKRQNWP